MVPIVLRSRSFSPRRHRSLPLQPLYETYEFGGCVGVSSQCKPTTSGRINLAFANVIQCHSYFMRKEKLVSGAADTFTRLETGPAVNNLCHIKTFSDAVQYLVMASKPVRCLLLVGVHMILHSAVGHIPADHFSTQKAV